MVPAAAKAAMVPGVVEIEDKWRVNADGRLEAFGRLPGAVANAGNPFSVVAGRMQRNAVAVHCYGEAVAAETLCFVLKPFERAVHVANTCAASRLFAKNNAGHEIKWEYLLDPCALAIYVEGDSHLQQRAVCRSLSIEQFTRRKTLDILYQSSCQCPGRPLFAEHLVKELSDFVALESHAIHRSVRAGPDRYSYTLSY